MSDRDRDPFSTSFPCNYPVLADLSSVTLLPALAKLAPLGADPHFFQLPSVRRALRTWHLTLCFVLARRTGFSQSKVRANKVYRRHTFYPSLDTVWDLSMYLLPRKIFISGLQVARSFGHFRSSQLAHGQSVGVWAPRDVGKSWNRPPVRCGWLRVSCQPSDLTGYTICCRISPPASCKMEVSRRNEAPECHIRTTKEGPVCGA